MACSLLKVLQARLGRRGFDSLRNDLNPRLRCTSLKQRLLGLAILAIASVGCIAPGHSAVNQEDAAKIRSAVRSFLDDLHAERGDKVTVEVGYLDSRLRLAACDEGAQAFLPAGSRTMGHVTVGVRCSGPTPWTVFVGARIGVTGTVLVASRALRRGESLSVEELRSVEKDLGGLSQGYITSIQQVVGKRLKRSAREGQVIAPSMLEYPPLVRRGEHVAIVFKSDTFYVRAEGVALADGGAGETIRVRNRSSEKVLEAEVIAASLVRVNR